MGNAGARSPALAEALAAEEEGLLTCVHCGFCLPACPTYVRLGDENDSPRGRLHLMRAVVEGRLDAGSDAFQEHIDRCLGCRACEPVCPSGVPYGSLLELARREATAARPPGLLTRLLLGLFGSRARFRGAMAAARLLRATGLPDLLARRLPDALMRVRLGAGMLAASASGAAWTEEPAPAAPASAPPPEGPPLRAALLRGCVQHGLFARVGRATDRVLRANGVETVTPPGQGCCGALHAHAGELGRARELARRNVEAFLASGADVIVVDAAGCGAAMKGYGHLLEGDPVWADRAAELSDRVRDVSEVLAGRGPRRGAPLGSRPLKVAWDPPCHLLHAQGVEHAPLRILDAVPGLDRVPVQDASECCGGAGIYGITHPGLGGSIGRDKVEAIRRSGAEVVATANPGCIMQIGAGLRMAGIDLPVVHPVELLDESYRRAGLHETSALHSRPAEPGLPAPSSTSTSSGADDPPPSEET